MAVKTKLKTISLKDLKEAGCVTFTERRERKIVLRARHSDLHLLNLPCKLIAVSAEDLEVLLSERFRHEAAQAIDESIVYQLTERHLDRASESLARTSQRLSVGPDTQRGT